MGRFVVIDRIGKFRGSYRTEAEANEAATDHTERWPNLAPTRVHPIGPALPGPAPVPAQKTLGQVCGDTYLGTSKPASEAWELAATAVIAAHEAGRETERIVRWAVRLAPGWFGSNFCNANKSERTLFNLREHAEVIAQSFTGARIVPVPTRRRRVVKS